MIHSFEEKNLEKLFTSGKSQSGLPTDITNSLKRALNELHAAGSEAVTCSPLISTPRC